MTELKPCPICRSFGILTVHYPFGIPAPYVVGLNYKPHETDATIEPCKSCQERHCNDCEWLKRVEGR